MIVIPPWVNMSVLVAVSGFAWIKGGTAERFAATCFLASHTLYVATRPLTVGGEPSEVLRDIVLDGALAALFVGLALRSTRYWTVILAAITVFQPIYQVAQLIRPVSPWTYGTVGIFFWYLAMLVIVWGTVQTWQARRKAAA